MTTENLYADRDVMQLDEDGGHYCRHVDRMTAEGLHSKSDIAAELGFRDMLIAGLKHNLHAIKFTLDQIKEADVSDDAYNKIELALEIAE